jgi:hypothetical protein
MSLERQNIKSHELVNVLNWQLKAEGRYHV